MRSERKTQNPAGVESGNPDPVPPLHWTRLGLDWIRTIANFVEFGLDPDYKSLKNSGTGPDLD